MDDDSWMRLILLPILTIGAAYCAASEISYAAMNKIRVKNYAQNGNKRAITAMYISNHFDQALITLLISNNIMNISFGSLAALISTQLWGLESVKYTTIITAVFVFLFNEMIPKSFAKANSEKFALAVSGSLYSLMKILSPVAFVFIFISGKLSVLFPESQEPAVTEGELYDIIETAQVEWVLDKDKQELVHSALNFDIITAGDIFTKRKDIVALDINSTHQEILNKIKTQKYSRLPVYKDNMDNFVGILHVRNFLKVCITQDNYDLKGLLLQPHFFSIRTPIDDLMREMSSKKLHMSIVVDDSQKIVGIATMEDILEELVGEIWDEKDVVNDEYVRLVSTRNKPDNVHPVAKNLISIGS